MHIGLNVAGKRRPRFLVFGAIFASVYFAISFFYLNAAGTPSVISYQGRLADSTGNLLGGEGTTYYFKFSIWDAKSGGTRLWPSAAPSSFPSVVREGVFNVNIGDIASGFPDPLDFDFNVEKEIYLQVEVSPNNIVFQTLTPRQRVGSSPFAELSRAVSGESASSFGTTTPFAGAQINIEATSTLSKLLVLRSRTGQISNIFEIQNGLGDSLFFIDRTGNIFSSSSIQVSGGATFYGNLTASYASTTAISASAICLGGDCIYSWPLMGGGVFSTTSANYWKSVTDFFSTTSANYWKSVNNFFSTTSAEHFINSSTSIANAPGGTTGNVLQWNGTRWVSVSTSSLGFVSSLWEKDGSTIYYLNGRVGIGTSEPEALFHVDGGYSISPEEYTVIIKGTEGGTSFLGGSVGGGILLEAGKGADGSFPLNTPRPGGSIVIKGGEGGYESLGGAPGGDVYIDGGEPGYKNKKGNIYMEGYRVLINSSVGGNVGIGTLTPTEKLTVEGKIVGSNFSALTFSTSTFPTVSITKLLYDGTGKGGSNGQILQSTGTGIKWIDYTPNPWTVSGSDIYYDGGVSINGTLAVNTQTATPGMLSIFRLHNNRSGADSGTGILLSALNNSNALTNYAGISGAIVGDFSGFENGKLNLRVMSVGTLRDIMTLYGDSIQTFPSILELTSTKTGNRSSYIDFHGDDTYTDFALRVGRENTGANASSVITHRGTGKLILTTADAATLALWTNNTERFYIDSSGKIFAMNLSGKSGADYTLCIDPTTKEITWYNGSCTSSSLRFKEDIEDISYGLDAIMNLRPVSFYFNRQERPDGDKRYLGFIAEEVLGVLPEVVTYDSQGLPAGVEYSEITPVLARAIQELNINLMTLASTTASTTQRSEAFANSFFRNMFNKMIAWFADVTNEIGDFFANRVRTQQLCIGEEGNETCITKSQLDELLLLEGINNSTGSISTGSTSTEEEIIEEESIEDGDMDPEDTVEEDNENQEENSEPIQQEEEGGE